MNRTRRGTRKRSLSRRRFMTLLAAGSATAALAPARAVVAATAPAAKPAAKTASASPQVRAEIEKQKKGTAAQLKVIRDFVLPPGSPMAFEFKPLRKRGK